MVSRAASPSGRWRSQRSQARSRTSPAAPGCGGASVLWVNTGARGNGRAQSGGEGVRCTLWTSVMGLMRWLRWRTRDWVGLMPNGLGQVKPNHYLEMVKVAWANRDQLPFSWRILSRGVCDGCALGTTGLRDFTMKGPHLCTVRLNLLRLNTAPGMDVSVLEDVGRLEGKSAGALRALGRLPYPMVRRKGERGFRRVAWDEALGLVGERIRTACARDARRLAFYVTSRGVTNETYYVAQKVARFLGTNNVDNSSRICHAPSAVALKKTVGASASTCSYRDWYGTDLLVFVGSDVPNNQPVTTKYIYEARQRGTKVLVINPYREPGLERYWVPSALESAVFGTKLTDRFFQISTGGDIGFLNGVLKHLVENGWVDEACVRRHTYGYDELVAALEAQSWEQLERTSGTTREEMLDFARLYGQAKTAVFVWSMGLTQHRFGVDNVTALVNLALARGMVGRERCGLMPIRGHSGVQGSAETGAVPNALPGGGALDDPAAIARFERLWGFAPPREKGQTAAGGSRGGGGRRRRGRCRAGGRGVRRWTIRRRSRDSSGCGGSRHRGRRGRRR